LELATYGSRANAGVIQIFTKRGKTGAAKVSFSSTYTSSSLRKKLEVNQSPVKFGGPTDGVGALTQDIITAPFATTTTPVTRYDYQDYIFRTELELIIRFQLVVVQIKPNTILVDPIL
jgi:outer membrane cobalamin receptor